MQDRADRPQEAVVWLKDHFDGDPDPEIDIRWKEGQIAPEAYQRLLDILFSPAD